MFSSISAIQSARTPLFKTGGKLSLFGSKSFVIALKIKSAVVFL